MKRIDNLKWDKLDNTAILFPVIAKEGTTNVYRISVVLKEEIQENLLQQSLNEVLPYFDVFRNRMKMGIFWYYFETNRKSHLQYRRNARILVSILIQILTGIIFSEFPISRTVLIWRFSMPLRMERGLLISLRNLLLSICVWLIRSWRKNWEMIWMK